jgi:hypothetical protein
MGVGSLQLVAADLTNNGKIGIADYYTYVTPTVTVWLHK